MKRFLAILLTLALVLPMIPVLGHTAHADATAEADIKPFYGLGWSDINRRMFSNVDGMVAVTVNASDDGTVTLSFNGKRDLDKMAASLKAVMDERPEGMRYMKLFGTGKALKAGAEAIIYADAGIAQLKTQFTALLQKYAALGGKLDGVIMDTEYTAMGAWYVYTASGGPYEATHKDIYQQIVDHPKYLTEIRPLLEERGFVFFQQSNASEIYSIFPQRYMGVGTSPKVENKTQYAKCNAIWGAVMHNRQSAYFNDAVYAPLKEYYPNAILSDYQTNDSYAWLKNPTDAGDDSWHGGNVDKIGNASDYNTYSSRPNSSFFVSNGEYLYQNPVAYNKANYEDAPYNMFLWDIHKFKDIYAATDTKIMNAWIAEYDYETREGSAGNTPYYAES